MRLDCRRDVNLLQIVLIYLGDDLHNENINDRAISSRVTRANYI